MNNIQKLRQRIDDIDDQILELINQRLEVAKGIGDIKNRSGAAVIDRNRESQIYQRLAGLNNGPLNESALHRIFGDIITAGRAIQNLENQSNLAALYVVIGNPIGHSLSPVMHNTALTHSGLSGYYLACQVEDIAAAVVGIRGLGICGASVTIPHKIAVMQYLDKIDQMAVDIGAVNTIVNQNGILHGYNSDCEGAIKALVEVAEVKGKDVAIVGAGGAARALGFGLKQAGASITVINRTGVRGEKLAQDLRCRFSPLAELKELPYHIVVNATPVGMTPDVDGLPLSPGLLERESVVMDMVYNPLKTRLLRAAEDIGCTTIDGVSMFVHQGAVQFELWTSQKAPVDVMRKVVLEQLLGT